MFYNQNSNTIPMNHICKELATNTPELVIQHNQSELTEGQWVVLVVTKSENIAMDDTETVIVKQSPSSYHVSTEVAFWQNGEWHGLSGMAMWHSEGVYAQVKISDDVIDLDAIKEDDEENRSIAIDELTNLNLD